MSLVEILSNYQVIHCIRIELNERKYSILLNITSKNEMSSRDTGILV